MRREELVLVFLVLLDEKPGILCSASRLWSRLAGALDDFLLLAFFCFIEA